MEPYFWERSEYPLLRDPSGFVVASGSEDVLAAPSSTDSSSDFFDAQLREFVKSRSKVEPSAQCSSSVGTTYRTTLKNEIRIFELRPGQPEDELHGRLEYVNVEFEYAPLTQERLPTYSRLSLFGLSSRTFLKIPYTAVSYCWGSADFNYKVKLPGSTSINITSTVDTMLRHLRHTDQSVNLWIDQICIDQNDRLDKETQVTMMSKIYSKAQNTLIWLGEEAEKGAFRAMQGLHEATYGEMGMVDLLDDQLEYLRQDPSTFDALEQLFQRPWFQRTWVVQEAVLSNHVFIMAGSESISWEDFAGYCVSVKDLDLFKPSFSPRDGRPVSSGLHILTEIYLARSDFLTSQAAPPLISWLVATRYAAVTQPVDKVYGVLGLCANPLPPDYRKTQTELFQEVTLKAIQDELKILRSRRDTIKALKVPNHAISRILSCVDHDPESHEMPSWVIDWSRPRYTTALAHNTSCLGVYQAGGATGEEAFSLKSDGQVLTAVAMIFDDVRSLAPVVVNADLNYINPVQANESLQQSITFANEQQSRTRQNNIFTTFCSTIVAGKNGTGLLKFPHEYIEILSLLCDETIGSSPSFPDQIYTPRHRKGHWTLSHLTRRDPGRNFQNLKRAYRHAMLNRRLAYTSKGCLSLVPRFTKVDDTIVVFPGCPAPFVVRKREAGGFKLIGECYVHDLMNGQAMRESEIEPETIEIS